MVREPIDSTRTGWKVVTAGAATTAVAVAFGFGPAMAGQQPDVSGIELVAQDQDLARLVTESAFVVPLATDDLEAGVPDDSSDSALDSDDLETEFVAPEISASARAAGDDATGITQLASFDSSDDSDDSEDSLDSSDDSIDSDDSLDSSEDSPDSIDSDDSLDT